MYSWLVMFHRYMILERAFFLATTGAKGILPVFSGAQVWRAPLNRLFVSATVLAVMLSIIGINIGWHIQRAVLILKTRQKNAR